MKTLIHSRHIGLCLAFALAAGTACAEPDADAAFVAQARSLALPLETAEDLEPLLERVGGVRYVLLGEASHGTSEFYTWRDKISRRLIEEKGFRFIAVEGDWDACYRLNRYVKDLPGAGASARAILEEFDRWPLWMWANEEVEALIEWLREHNLERPLDERVGFYGIDLYGISDSLARVPEFLRAHDAEAAEFVSEAYACLEAFSDSYHDYARAAAEGRVNCAGQAEAVLGRLQAEAARYRAADRRGHFNAKLNALVVRNAEAHYRAMGAPGGDSWNVRVNHFLDTVERLMAYKGEEAKGIVWAHNTHIGDARATAMRDQGSTNIGQLLRQRYGTSSIVAVGFGTHRGSVLAGRAWEAPMERMRVPTGIPGSVEDLFHQAARAMERDRFLLIFEPGHWEGPLRAWRGHRAIGVVYRPEEERGNYVPTMLPLRYDAFIFIDETSALSPVHD